MKISVITAACSLLAFSAIASAQYGSVYTAPRAYSPPAYQAPAQSTYGSGSNPSNVQSSGYERSNGTYVQPYERSAPNSTRQDNYSTQGNVNPYTGAAGTKRGGW